MKIFVFQKHFLIFGGLLLQVSGLFAQPLDVTIASFSYVSCNSVCDGGATAASTGGTAPYTYSWSNGDTVSVADSLCAGNYTVVVTDSVDSVDSAMVTITEPPPFFSSITGQTNVKCKGSCDGTAIVTPAGGTSPYTYTWLDSGLNPLNPPQTDSTATGLCALMYIVQIVDTNGCSSLSSVTITEPAVLSANVDSATSAQCKVCDGKAYTSGSGGILPYTYLWSDSNAQTTPIADSLCASTYTLTLSDSNGCIATKNAVVTGPGGLSSYIDTIRNISCNGLCDGYAEVKGSGGNPPYTYSWINLSIPDTIAGAVDTFLTGLCAGSYYAAVTDSDTCVTTTLPIIIPAIPPFLANIFDSSGVLCFGDSNGTATVSIINGIPPFVYVWSNGDSVSGFIDTITKTDLFPGTQSVIVTDSNGCLAIDSVFISSPTGLTASITDSNNANCGGMCDGSATVSASGGTPPYSYLWDSGTTPTDSATAGLCAGTHTVTVTDTNGCNTIIAVTITEPLLLSTLIFDSTLVSCNGKCDGSAALATSGGTPPYTYLWTNNDTANFTDSLCAGSFTVTVTDAKNCTVQDSVLITEPLILAVNVIESNAACVPLCDGSATLAASGGTLPFTYLWLNGEPTATADSLCSGINQLTVTDANGCTAIDSVNILSDTLPLTADAGIDISICLGDSVTLSATGGISYKWNPAPELSCASCPNPVLTPLSTKTYTVLVKNLACVDSDYVTITVDLCLIGPIPEIITPNGDGTNDIFELPNIEKYYNNKIIIYNQWGDVVFSTSGYHNDSNYWDGKTNDGKSLPDATYFYILKLEDGIKPQSGFVMIYR